MDPLLVCPDYNPEADDELLNNLGEIKPDDLLVLVTVTVPSDLTQMSVNLKFCRNLHSLNLPLLNTAADTRSSKPFSWSARYLLPLSLTGERKAIQVIAEGDTYQVKFPIYDILNKKKAGE